MIKKLVFLIAFLPSAALASVTFTSTPTASNYDGTDVAGTMDITATTTTEIDATNEYYACLFGSITIPSGQVIESAYLSCYFPTSTLDEPNHPMYAHDVATPTVLTTAASNIVSRTTTTATVTWASTNLGAAGRFNSPDLKTIIQELYDSYGPYNNMHIMIILKGSATATRDFAVATADNGVVLNRPYLSITYGPIPKKPRRIISTQAVMD